MREFILCFDPPITIDNWSMVAEVLNEKGLYWSNTKSVIEYDPFSNEEAQQMGMLAYNKWPFESKPVLTWDSECKVDPQDTLFGKLPILDGWQWVEENSTNYDETSSLFDSLNEGYWEDFYKSKRYTQKFEPGDRVIMNGTVGSKTLNNELGTVLKYKLTGGGVGRPHRVYLILFDTWNDRNGNFLMSPVQADQNREFVDSRCREGSCWYTTSDNLEPAPDSSELFDSLNESSLNEDVRRQTPRVGDYLLCHTKLVMDYGGVEAIVGDIYPIIDMNNGIVVIKNKSGDPHSFELRGGDSYKRWFTHIPQENYDSVSNTEFWDPI